MTEYGEKLARIEGRLDVMAVEIDTALEGVANFRKHATRADEFFTRSEARMDADDKAAQLKRDRRPTQIAIATILATILIPIGGFLAGKLYATSMDVIEIVREWKQAHGQQKGEFFDHSTKPPQQDATNPNY